ncbi:MAG: WG repeat-containing protein [Saprospiraceae bacterium]
MNTLHSLCQRILTLYLCLLYVQAKTQDVGATWIIPPVLDVDSVHISPVEDDHLFLVEKDKKSGVANKKGHLIIPVDYKNVRIFPGDWILAGFGKDSKLFNPIGVEVGLLYNKFNVLENQLAIVYIDSLCGMINQQGEEVVPVKYKSYTREGLNYTFKNKNEERSIAVLPNIKDKNVQRVADAKARSFLPNVYYIQISKNENGLLDLNHDTLVPPIYWFGPVHPSGLIVASFDGKNWGIIDSHHKTIYPFTAQHFGRWSGGWTKSGLIPVKKDNQWALMRFPKGEIVIPFGKYEMIETYDDINDLFLVTQNKLQGLIDTKGKVYLPCAYKYISEADHNTTELAGPDEKRGFYFRRTGFLQEPIYNSRSISNLKDSLVIVHRDSTHAVINSKNGKEVIPFSKYEIVRVGNYFESFTSSYSFNHLIQGLYDRTGKLIVQHDTIDIYVVLEDNSFWVCPQYKDSGQNFEHRTSGGKLLHSMPKKGAKFERFGFYIKGVMNGDGISTAKQFFYRDANDEERYYEAVGKSIENLRMIKREGFWGFVDESNKVIIQPVFDDVVPSRNGYIKVKYLGKWGVLQNPTFDYFAQFESQIKK